MVSEAMAYLNVRERRIEAKIAWVGPELGAIASSFDSLSSAGNPKVIDSAHDVVSLAWTAAAHPRFRDCGVKIDLVGLGGAPSDEHLKSVVGDADGIVFVASPSPTAGDANRAVFRALGRARSKEVPVVVHVSAAVDASALAPGDVIAALEATTLPRAGGVVETLELTLAEILGALEAKAPNESTAVTSGDGAPPLLGALRRILTETIDRHIDALEPRFVAGRDGLFGRIEGALAKLVERSAVDEKQLIGLRDRLDALASGTVAKGDLTAAVTRIQRMREEIGGEVVRALEGQRRADREQLAAATTTTTKALDAVDGRIAAVAKTSEAKVGDVEASVETLRAETSESVGKLSAKIEVLQETLEALIEELKRPKKGWFA